MNALDLNAVARALGGEVSGGQVLAPSPGHSAEDRSLSVKLDPNAPDGFAVHSIAENGPIDCRDFVRKKLGLRGNGAALGVASAHNRLISRFAALDRLTYEQCKRGAAKQLGVTPTALDKLVAEARSEVRGKDRDRWKVERWPEEVATGDLLSELRDAYASYVFLPEHGAVAMALWTLHAWAIDAADCSPFLMFSSPEMRCGKSTALTLLKWTGPRTVLASNITPAAIYRYIETERPTLLIDEAETFIADKEEVRGILNSGHTRDTAFVVRTVGDHHEPKEFSTWAPKALASIGKLAATLRDRAIVLPMRRKKPGEEVKKLRDRDDGAFRALREKAKRWAEDNVETLKAMRPSLPDELNDRAADNWHPLLAIADLAGGDWPDLARRAALALSTDADATDGTIGVQLLAAIREIFERRKVDALPSAVLVNDLTQDPEGLWAEYGRRGEPITAKQVASLLEPYKIKPDVIRDGTRTYRGYKLEWFKDAFERYLPSEGAFEA